MRSDAAVRPQYCQAKAGAKSSRSSAPSLCRLWSDAKSGMMPRAEPLAKVALREKHPVCLVPNLGEVTYSCRAWVGDKVEPVRTGARRCCRLHLDSTGVLQVETGESNSSVAKVHAPGYSFPFEMK